MEEVFFPSIEPPQIFCSQKIRQRRNRAAKICQEQTQRSLPFSALSKDVENIIFSHISPLNHDFKTILVIGDKSQNLALTLKKIFPSADLFFGAHSGNRLGKTVNALKMSEEAFPFKKQSFDLIVSMGTLHTLNDLPGALFQAHKCLKPDGLFVASFVGGDSLSTLRQTLYEIENQYYNRATARIHPLVNPSMGTALLQRAGFSVPVVTQDKKTVTFSDTFQMSHALRSIGETGTLKDPLPPLSRSFWQAVDQAYSRNNQGKIEVHFHILTLAGRAFHPNQQQHLNVSKHSLHLSR